MIEFNLLFVLVLIAIVVVSILTVAGGATLAERKVSAWMQDRVGPDRVGPLGTLQPLADGIKMFLKEDIVPKHVDKLFFVLGPILSCAIAMMGLTLIPVGPSTPAPAPVPLENGVVTQAAVDTFTAQMTAYQKADNYSIASGIDIGILFSFAVGSLAVYGIILGGWSSNSKYALLGSLRASAQIISYEIPLGMSIVGLILFTGSLNLEKIIDWQANNGWFILYQPLAFLLFITSVYAECNRLPFDLPEAEQELVGGYHTECSSMKFGFYMIGEYTHMISTSFLMAICFFGGWHFPGISMVDGYLGAFLKFGILMSKVGGFLLLYLLVRWTIPRFRFDQLMGLAWQVMFPLALINLVFVIIIREYDLSNWILTGISGGLFFGAAILSTREVDNKRRKVSYS